MERLKEQMSNVITLLRDAAEIEKKACTNFIVSYSSSGISALVKGGVPFEKATSLVKEACEKDPQVRDFITNATAFEKAAEHIETQDSRIVELEKIAAEIKQELVETDKNNPFNKLASIGFTKEEIALMAELPENLVTKVASAGSQPWELGGGSGIPR